MNGDIHRPQGSLWQLCTADGNALFNSSRAWRMMETPELSASSAKATATSRSGQRLPVRATPPAARITARLPIASLRLQSQTERMLASPSRKA